MGIDFRMFDKIHNEECFITYAILVWSLVTTAWRVLGLRMEGRPSVMDGSCGH
jgi:hypothetical protein